MPHISAYVSSNQVVLPNTDGGEPHITLVWCPTDEKFTDDHVHIASRMLTGKPLHVAKAVPNSFFKESKAATRHDVLLELDDASDLQITNARKHAALHSIPCGVMRKPHITYCTTYDKAERDRKLAEIQNHLPLAVVVHQVR